MRRREHAAAIAIAFVVGVFIFRNLLLDPGIWDYADASFPVGESALRYLNESLSGVWWNRNFLGYDTTFQTINSASIILTLDLLHLFTKNFSLMQFLWYLAVFMVAFVSMYALVLHIFGDYRIASISGLFYVLNPWIVDRIIVMPIYQACAFIPALLLFYILYLERRRFVYALAFSVSAFFIIPSLHYTCYAAIIVATYSIYHLFSKTGLKGIRGFLSANLKIILLSASMLAFFSFPLVYAFLLGGGGSVSVALERFAGSIPAAYHYGGNMKIYNTIRLLGFHDTFFRTPHVWFTLWSFLLPVVVVLPLFGKEKSSEPAYFFYLFVITGIFLSSATRLIEPDNYRRILMAVPLVRVLAKLPDPHYHAFLTTFAYAPLVGLSLVSLTKGLSVREKNLDLFLYPVIAFILFAPLVYPLVAWSDRRFEQFNYPDGYMRVSRYLKQNANGSRVYVWPPYHSLKHRWVPYFTSNLDKFVYNVDAFGQGIFETTPQGSYRFMQKISDNVGDETAFTGLLRLANTRYLVYTDDVEEDPPYIKLDRDKLLSFARTVKKSGNINTAVSDGVLKVYRLSDSLFLPHIYAAPEVRIINEGDAVLPLLARSGFIPERPALLLADGERRSGIKAILEGAPETAKLFSVNGNPEDAALDLALDEAIGPGQSKLRSFKPALVRASPARPLKITVMDEDNYSIWYRDDESAIAGLRAVRIGNSEYPVDTGTGYRKWRWLAVKKLRRGSYRVEVQKGDNPRGQPARPNEAVFLFVSKKNLESLKKEIGSIRTAYIFHKKERTGHVTKGEFFLSRSGLYSLELLSAPSEKDIRSYRIDDDFKKGIPPGWTFRLRSGEEGDTRDVVPVLFNRNFTAPLRLNGANTPGLWRWMSNSGEMTLLNPFKAEINVDVELTMLSYGEDRSVTVYLNGKPVRKVTLSGPDVRPDEGTEERVREYKDLYRGSGKSQKIVLNDLVLRPGPNRIIFKTVPSARLVGRGVDIFLSIAVRDGLKVSPRGVPGTGARWANGKGLKIGLKKKALVISDHYSDRGGEVAWITRYMKGEDIYDYQIFVMKYSIENPEVQGMYVGFRFDTDGDGMADRYFSRAVRPSGAMIPDRFELNLLEEFGAVFPDIKMKSASITGVDIFPYRKVGKHHFSGDGDTAYDYIVKGLMLASPSSSVDVLGTGDLRQARFFGKAPHTPGAGGVDLTVEIPVAGDRDPEGSTGFSLPVKRGLFIKSTLLVFPYRFSGDGDKSINIYTGYDLNGDNKADRYLPLGRRLPLYKWELLSRDMKEPLLLYRARLPLRLPPEYSTRNGLFNNLVVLKDGRPLEPVWDNEFKIYREQVQVDADGVVINLPRNEYPDGFTYELYYLPPEWRKDNFMFSDFQDIAVETSEVSDPFPDRKSVPVEIKYVLRCSIPSNSGREVTCGFKLKAPIYARTLYPLQAGDVNENNIPSLTLDGRKTGLSTAFEGDEYLVRSVGKVFLDRGLHRFEIKESGLHGLLLFRIESADAIPVKTPPEIRYRRMSATEYRVRVKDYKGPFVLVLAESFSRGWEAYARPLSAGGGPGNPDEVRLERHFEVNGYANGWLVAPEGSAAGGDFIITIRYRPQRYYRAGIYLSILTLAMSVIYAGYRGRKRGVK